MDRSRFERLVRRALGEIPKAFRDTLDNVDVAVEDWPSRSQLAGTGLDEEEVLLGLYEGVPLAERHDYGMVLPDKITLFQRAIEGVCATDEQIVKEIRQTVVHEVAHHFGIDDERLRALGVE